MSDEFKRYLGIDWGDARIGLALGDNETKMASPLGVAASIPEILKIIKEEEVDKIILGKPVKMSGSEVGLTPEFVTFAERLKKKTNLPIGLVDERLTSKAADALSGDKKTKASRDALAAMLILQTYLDKL